MDLCEQLAHTTISGGTATSAVSPAILSTGNPLAVTNASAAMLASVGQINPFASGSTESKHEAYAQSSVSSMRGMFGYSNLSIRDSNSSTSAWGEHGFDTYNSNAACMQGLWKIFAQSVIDENRQPRHILAAMPEFDTQRQVKTCA